MTGGRVFILLISLHFLPSLSVAQSSAPIQLFEQASQAYKAQDYNKALELWQAIEIKTPAVWFNMANASYELNKKNEALVYWLRAWHQSKNPLRSQSFSQAQRVMKELGVQENFLATCEQQWWLKIPLLLWQLLLLLLLVIMVVCATRLARKKRWYMLGALVIFFMATGVVLITAYHHAWFAKAVVIKEHVFLYTGPDEQFDTLVQVPLASMVSIESNSRGWFKVRYGKNSGWIVGTTVARLDHPQ